MIPSFGNEEIVEALDSMFSTYVTMGKKVRLFEEKFARYVGSKYAIMVNSGSSANLVILAALKELGYLDDGDRVLTPALTWATTIFPIIQLGLRPVFADVDLDTMVFGSNQLDFLNLSNIQAIMPVHLLGNPCEMDCLTQITNKYNAILIEDCCEAHGARYNNKHVGTFGMAGTFSFFISHHISTIEGGMIVTDDKDVYNICKGLRQFGWVRDRYDKDIIEKDYPKIDNRFLFVNCGYNFKPTEIQGAFGIHQIDKLDKFIDIRKNNADFWIKSLKSDYITPQKRNDDCSEFAFALTVQPNAPFTRDDLMIFLEENGIETGPIMAGNILEQPVMEFMSDKYDVIGSLCNTEYIADNSFFFGNHHGIGELERSYVKDVIYSFFGQYT